MPSAAFKIWREADAAQRLLSLLDGGVLGHLRKIKKLAIPHMTEAERARLTRGESR